MKTERILEAVATAYRAFKAGFARGRCAEELFSAFTASLDAGLFEYELLCDFLCGADTVNIDGITRGYVPQQGDTILMDISVGKDGTWCDVCRTYFVGEPSEAQRKVFEMIKESLRAGERALRVGARACDVYAAVNGVYERTGAHLVHHAGHRVGEKALMQPQFLAQNDTPLACGELYTLESGLYEGFGIRLENDYLLTKDGARDLFERLLPLDIKEYVL